MKKHEEMMILPAAERLAFFRKWYCMELARAHINAQAAGIPFRWPMSDLDKMVDKAMGELTKRHMVIGKAMDASLAYFQIKTQKELWGFLGVSK